MEEKKKIWKSIHKTQKWETERVTSRNPTESTDIPEKKLGRKSRHLCDDFFCVYSSQHNNGQPWCVVFIWVATVSVVVKNKNDVTLFLCKGNKSNKTKEWRVKFCRPYRRPVNWPTTRKNRRVCWGGGQVCVRLLRLRLLHCSSPSQPKHQQFDGWLAL